LSDIVTDFIEFRSLTLRFWTVTADSFIYVLQTEFRRFQSVFDFASKYFINFRIRVNSFIAPTNSSLYPVEFFRVLSEENFENSPYFRLFLLDLLFRSSIGTSSL